MSGERYRGWCNSGGAREWRNHGRLKQSSAACPTEIVVIMLGTASVGLARPFVCS